MLLEYCNEHSLNARNAMENLLKTCSSPESHGVGGVVCFEHQLTAFQSAITGLGECVKWGKRGGTFFS